MINCACRYNGYKICQYPELHSPALKPAADSFSIKSVAPKYTPPKCTIPTVDMVHIRDYGTIRVFCGLPIKNIKTCGGWEYTTCLKCIRTGISYGYTKPKSRLKELEANNSQAKG